MEVWIISSLVSQWSIYSCHINTSSLYLNKHCSINNCRWLCMTAFSVPRYSHFISPTFTNVLCGKRQVCLMTKHPSLCSTKQKNKQQKDQTNLKLQFETNEYQIRFLTDILNIEYTSPKSLHTWQTFKVSHLYKYLVYLLKCFLSPDICCITEKQLLLVNFAL